MDNGPSHWQFNALPLGLSAAPRIFTKIMAFFRIQSVSIVPYLDDFLIFARDKESLIRDLQLVLRTFQDLGWKVNQRKSCLVLSQNILFLGYLIDSVAQKTFLPEEKF